MYSTKFGKPTVSMRVELFSNRVELLWPRAFEKLYGQSSINTTLDWEPKLILILLKVSLVAKRSKGPKGE